MNLCVIGTGYVGLVAGACLADMGNSVTCVDNDQNKLDQLQAGRLPIFEPGLEELVLINAKEHRLSFTSDLPAAVRQADVIFIAVGTPQGDNGFADLGAVYAVAKSIGQNINGYKVIVDKSTVPVGTAQKVRDIIAKETDHPFDVVSNPEFLKQGAAVDDFLSPDRVVIGADSERASKLMQEIYSPFMRTGNRIILMDVASAEMTKYAANAFLAVKISFMNEIAGLCEKVGADAELVRIGMSTDARIGNKFLFPGVGYGGSCFPKDVEALVAVGKTHGQPMTIAAAANAVNDLQRQKFAQRIMAALSDAQQQKPLTGKTIAVWGLAFKPKTNDMRKSPAIDIIKTLVQAGAAVQAYDPKAMDTAKQALGALPGLVYASSSYDAVRGADALVLLTEWNEFRRPDFEKMKTLMRGHVIFDGRNQYSAKRLHELGYTYHSIGKA